MPTPSPPQHRAGGGRHRREQTRDRLPEQRRAVRTDAGQQAGSPAVSRSPAADRSNGVRSTRRRTASRSSRVDRSGRKTADRQQLPAIGGIGVGDQVEVGVGRLLQQIVAQRANRQPAPGVVDGECPDQPRRQRLRLVGGGGSADHRRRPGGDVRGQQAGQVVQRQVRIADRPDDPPVRTQPFLGRPVQQQLRRDVTGPVDRPVPPFPGAVGDHREPACVDATPHRPVRQVDLGEIGAPPRRDPRRARRRPESAARQPVSPAPAAAAPRCRSRPAARVPPARSATAAAAPEPGRT